MSSTEIIRAYFAERYRARFFVPLAVLLFAAGTYALGTTTTPLGAVAGAAVAYMAVLSFRIQDDIADRSLDRASHPDRITVRVDDLTPLRAVAGSAMLFVILVLAFAPGGWTALTGIAAIIVPVAAWYSARDALRASRRLNALIVLTKYPAIAFVAARAGTAARPAELFTPASISAFAGIYFLACLYEFLHDRGVRT